MISTGRTTILLLTRTQRARLWLRGVDWGEVITLAMLAALLLWAGVRAALPDIGAWLAPQPQLIYIVPTAALPTAPLATLAPQIIERQVIVVATPTAAPELPVAPVQDAPAPVVAEQAAPTAVPTSAPAVAESAPVAQAAPEATSAPLVGWGGGAPPPTEPGVIDQAADVARNAQRTIEQAVLGPPAPTPAPNGWNGGAGKGW